MRRYRFGPDVTSTTISAPFPPTGKTDVDIAIKEVRTSPFPATIEFAVDAYDPATANPLMTVHFIAVPPGIERPTDPTTAPSDPRFITYAADVSAVTDGAPLVITLDTLVGGVDYRIVTVLEDEIAT